MPIFSPKSLKIPDITNYFQKIVDNDENMLYDNFQIYSVFFKIFCPWLLAYLFIRVIVLIVRSNICQEYFILAYILSIYSSVFICFTILKVKIQFFSSFITPLLPAFCFLIFFHNPSLQNSVPFSLKKFCIPISGRIYSHFSKSLQKGGLFINLNPNRQVYDRAFKRVFSLSDTAITNLINGLFGRDFPTESHTSRPNGDFIRLDLKGRYSDVFITIAGQHTFHLEAQTSADRLIPLRAFEYGFHYAMSTQTEADSLLFPEPMVIYFTQAKTMPDESPLHISFSGQGKGFTYRIKNFLYLAHSPKELNRKKLAALIPFQVLRFRELLKAKAPAKGSQRKAATPCMGSSRKPAFSPEEFSRLQDEIRHDIIGTIETSLQMGYLTPDDAKQLYELAGFLDEHLRSELSMKLEGASEYMKPLLPGALELPNDKYRFRIDELEKENARYADENAKYADEITRYADEILKLQKRVAELEAKHGKN